MALVRWSCDCIGLDDVKNEQGESLVLCSCDGDGLDHYNVGAYFRPMAEKTKKPLTDQEIEPLVRELGAAINDGQRLRAIKAALGD